jgi:lysozyme
MNNFKIDDEGFRLIRSFEGYGQKMPNGDCCAYQTKLKGGLDIPTIGYGCTENVKMGMVWTKAQAEEALRREISKHELAISSLVKVPLNQNQVNACVSLSYNIGTGIGAKKQGFANSSILVNINKGDMTGAAQGFLRYTRAKGKVEKGLVSRRTRESALFQKPVVEPDHPWMPQADITAQPEPPHPVTVAGSTVVGGGFLYTAWEKVSGFFDGLDQDKVLNLLDVPDKHPGILKSAALFPWESALLYGGVAVGIYFLLGHFLPARIGGVND